jgi:hypothetical protein
MFADVWMVRVVGPPVVTVVGLKLQVAPVGRPEQLKLTVPVKPVPGVTVIVLVPLCPAITLMLVGFEDSAKFAATDPCHATASLSASTEPRPVTRL